MSRRTHNLLAVLASVAPPRAGAPAAGADQWFKTDTHVHSSAVSGDAPQDIGVISAQGRAMGFDAMFLTAHTAAGTQPIGGVISNHPRFDDDITQWGQDNYSAAGTATSTLTTSHATLAGSTLASGNTLLCELGAPTSSAAGVTSASVGNSTTNEMVALPVNTG